MRGQYQLREIEESRLSVMAGPNRLLAITSVGVPYGLTASPSRHLRALREPLSLSRSL